MNDSHKSLFFVWFEPFPSDWRLDRLSLMLLAISLFLVSNQSSTMYHLFELRFRLIAPISIHVFPVASFHFGTPILFFFGGKYPLNRLAMRPYFFFRLARIPVILPSDHFLPTVIHVAVFFFQLFVSPLVRVITWPLPRQEFPLFPYQRGSLFFVREETASTTLPSRQ